MASVKNDWIGYLDRSFQQIKTSILSRVTTAVPEMTDHSESNIFIVIIDIFSSIAEVLGFYIDNAAKESFIVTAERKTSVIKLSRGMDYRVKASSPEKVDLLLTWNAPISGGSFVLDLGLRITGTNGIVFRLMNDVTIPNGAVSSSIPLSQESLANLSTVTNGQRNQKISLGTDYVNKSIQLTIGGIPYTEVDTFANSSSLDTHFQVDILEDGIAYIVLGDGNEGVLPVNGSSVIGTYTTTLGPDGKVGAGGFDDTTLVLAGTLPVGVSIDEANSLLNSSGGADYEDIEKIRTNAVLSLRTINRMVTRSDHRFVINNVPGVAKSEVDFNCGKTIDIYIVPSGGGIAQTGLISEAQAEAEDKKMIATFPVIKPAGETRLILGTNVTAKKRKSLTDTKVQVDNALIEFGSVDNQEINGAIRLSDLQALIDNLSNVDFVDITKMYTIPYARPEDHLNILNWVNETLVASVIEVKWRIEYDGANFQIFRDSIYLGTTTIGVEFVSPSGEFKFTISASSYVAGNGWSFTVMPYLKNLVLDDFSIFTIQAGDLSNNILPAPVS